MPPGGLGSAHKGFFILSHKVFASWLWRIEFRQRKRLLKANDPWCCADVAHAWLLELTIPEGGAALRRSVGKKLMLLQISWQPSFVEASGERHSALIAADTSPLNLGNMAGRWSLTPRSQIGQISRNLVLFVDKGKTSLLI